MQLLKILLIIKKNIRYKIGCSLKSKYVPNIKFELDDSLKKYDEINKLLKNE